MDVRILFLNRWIIFVLCSVHVHMYTADAAVELQSYNLPDYYIHVAHRVSGGAVSIRRQAQPEVWQIESPGLCGAQGSASIRIGLDNSNIYIRYRNGLAYAEANDDTSSFSTSACFYIRHNKWFPGHVAFESVSLSGYYLRHQDLELKLHPYNSIAQFEMDASFRIFEPNCKRIQSYNHPNRYIGLTSTDAYTLPIPHLWIPLRPGLSGHKGSVAFRSCYNATNYLRHKDFLLKIDPFEYTQLFKLDATFTERRRFHVGTTAYESVNYPNKFIRHHYWRLRLDDYSAASIYKADASFKELNN